MAEEKMLRGKEPLTVWRGANGGPGGSVYRGGLIADPAKVDPDDVERLVEQDFLEWVTRSGEGFVLAEDTDTGDKGDPVTIGDAGRADPDEVDNGTVNSRLHADAANAAAKVDDGIAAKRAAARDKLPADGSTPDGRASKDVWVEFLAKRGYDYDELAKQDLSELKALAK